MGAMAVARTPKHGKAMTPAERKKAQRDRLAKFEIKVVEVKLSKRERETLAQNCKVRGGVRGAYDADEYIATLIRRDAERLEQQLAELGCCGKCGSPLPGGCDGLFKGDGECWHTDKAKSLML